MKGKYRYIILIGFDMIAFVGFLVDAITNRSWISGSAAIWTVNCFLAHCECEDMSSELRKLKGK